MKNKEKYAKEMLDLFINEVSFGVDKNTMKPCGCVGMGCDDCYFNSKYYQYDRGYGCRDNFKHWANSEYVEPKEFTEQERAVIKALDKIEWVAKQGNGEVWGYRERPTFKESQVWKGAMRIVDLTKTTSCEFRALHYYDLNPTSRAEILGGNEK